MKFTPQHFDSLFRCAPGPVVVLDSRFAIVAANDAFFRVTHVTRDAVGRDVFEVFPENPLDGSSNGWTRFRASLDRVIATAEPDRLPITRYDIPRPDVEGGGFEVRYWSPASYPILSDDGGVEFIVHETEDVTELVTLRDRDVRLTDELAAAQSAFEAISDQGLFVGRLDLEGRLVDANRSCLDECGFTRTDVIGKLFWECGWWNRSADAQARVRAAFEQARRGQPFRGESTYFWADGTERVVDLACMPITGRSGQVLFLFATGMDITERVRGAREQRATAILESITDAFFSLDQQWHFTYLNAQAEPQLLRKRGDLVGKVIWDEFPAARGTKFEHEYRRAMAERIAVTFEEYYPEPLGRWYEVNAYPTDEGLAVYFRNVTERRRAEDALADARMTAEQQARRFDATLSAVRDLVFAFDRDLRVCYANRSLLDLWGVTAEGAIGKTMVELGYPAETREPVAASIRHVLETGETASAEVPYRSPDGGFGYYDYTLAPVFDATGEVVQVVGSARDTTERRASEERLRESEGRFRQAELAANVGTYDWDLATNEVIWSDGIYNSLGLEPGSVRPTLDLWLMFLHPDDREGSHSAVQEAIASREEYYDEFRVVLPGGEVKWLASTGRAVYGDDGTPSRFLGVNLDVTKRMLAEQAAREHEERFGQIADNLPGGAIYQAILRGPGGAVEFPYVSRGMERLFGFTRDEIVADPGLLFGLIHKDDEARVRASNERSIERQCPFDEQFRSTTRDGAVRWVHARSAPRLTPAGHIWDGVLIDITAQKQAEERQALLAEAGRILGSSLDYERTLANVCRLVVPGLADWCTLDLVSEAGDVVRVELAHADPEKVALEHEFRRRYPPDSRDERGLMKVLRTGEAEVYAEISDEILRQGGRGEEHYRLLKSLGLKSVIIVPLIARGRTLGALSLITAESGRRYGNEDLQVASELAARAALAVDNARLLREAEEAARRREEALALHKAVDEQLTILVEASGSLIASLDPGSVLDAVVSLSRRLISADAYAIWRHDRAGGRWGIVSSSGLSEEFCNDTIVVLQATPVLTDGPVVAEDVLGSPILAGRRSQYEREGVKSLLAVPLKVRAATDGTITFYYREPHRFSEVEVRVATALANLASSAIGTSELYDVLKDNDRKKDEFLAMLAHELRNPLSAIGNAVQLARRSPAAEHQEWSRVVIDKHVQSLSRMIDDLLDVSRITLGKIELRKRPVDVVPVLSHAADTVRPLIEERKHDLTIAHSSSPMWVEADAHRLEQVLVNLLTNAAKYTDAGGKITLSARPDGGTVAISVRDNGSGILPERIPEMFELFTQGDRSIARSEGGLGIGLTLVKNLVELHGGSVTASSEGRGSGSEFSVRLDAVRAPAPERQPRSVTNDAGTRTLTTWARVLVVDDNEDSARGIARLLKVLGNVVEVAHDGPSALEAAHEFQPDYVLLDIGLPGMDGYQVAERLRAEGLNDAVIIAISGYGEEAARRRARDAGFDHHLVKPVDYDTLVALIRRDS